MPTVYGAIVSPFVRKVRVFLAEKNLPYELDPVVPFTAGAEYRKISPLGKIPAFRDGDRTLADSSVICAYLERTHPTPALYPSEPYAYARALWFEEYADGGMAPVVGPKIFFPRIVGPRVFKQQPDEAAIQKAIETDLPPLLAYLEGEIGDRAYLVEGRFSIADIGVATQFVNLQHAGVSPDATRYPGLARWLGSILSRPSFKAVIEEERRTFGIA